MINRMINCGIKLQNNNIIFMNKEDSPTLPICGNMS